jgi:hypothetical protein
MDKQTIFINPEKDFNRDQLYKGSALIQNYDEFQKLIGEFYSGGRIEQFFEEEKSAIRNELIKNVIGFGDGLNHIRAGYYLQKTIDNYFRANNRQQVTDNRSPNTNHQSLYNFHFWHFLVYYLIRIAGPFYNRALYSRLYKFNKHLWVFENYRMTKLHELYKRYVTFFEEFYKAKNIEERYKENSLFKNLL